jgi:hypothetical protein
MGRRRLLLVAAAVGGGLLCAVLVVGARVPRSAIVVAVERVLGHPLEVAHVRVRFVPQPALELVGVRAPYAGVVAGGVAAFEAQRVRLRLALGPLLAGRAVVDRMDLDGPLVRIVRPAEGHAPPGRANAGPDKGAGPEKRTRPSRRRSGRGRARDDDDQAIVRLRRVHVHKGRLQVIDEARATRWALGRIDSTVDLPPDLEAVGARAYVVLRGALRRGGRESLAELAVAGRLAWEDRQPRFRGRLESGPFAFGPLHFDGGDGRLAVDPRGAHLRGLELRLGAGAVHGRARALLGAAPTVALGIAGGGDALEDAFDETNVVVGGAWETAIAVRGPAPWRHRARRGLRGSGRVAIAAGVIEPFELGSALLDVLAPLRGREQSQQLRARYPDLFDERLVRFARLAGTFRLDGGRVRTHDLVLRGGAYRATGQGTVSVDGRLSLGIRLVLSATLTRDLLGRGGLAAAVGATPGREFVVPLQLDGTIEHPRIRTSPEWSRALIRRTLGGSGMGDLLEHLLR